MSDNLSFEEWAKRNVPYPPNCCELEWEKGAEAAWSHQQAIIDKKDKQIIELRKAYCANMNDGMGENKWS